MMSQGVAFFHKYLRLRGKCQESMYNLGRAFQQIGMTLSLLLTLSLTLSLSLSLSGVVHAACHFYRQALALEPENNDPKVQFQGQRSFISNPFITAVAAGQ